MTRPDEAVFRRTRPRGPLAEFVGSIWVYEGEGGDHELERRLPTPELELYLSLSGPSADLVGPATGPVMLGTAEQRSVLGVEFRIGAAPALLGVPAAELRDQRVPLAGLLGSDADALLDRVLAASGVGARLRAAEQALAARLRRVNEPAHPAARAAARRICATPGRLGVSALSDQLGLSVRRLEQVFRTDVGLSPKAYQRLQRFRSALSRIDDVPTVRWAEFAVESGYYDQSHLIRDFQHHAGLSPLEYAAARGPFLNHLPISG